jgi:hypothetical protein
MMLVGEREEVHPAPKKNFLYATQISRESVKTVHQYEQPRSGFFFKKVKSVSVIKLINWPDPNLNHSNTCAIP